MLLSPPQKTPRAPSPTSNHCPLTILQGQGEGWIKLGLQYRAVANIAGEEIRRANMGLLLVGVIRAYDLGGPSAKNSGLSSLVTVRITAIITRPDSTLVCVPCQSVCCVSVSRGTVSYCVCMLCTHHTAHGCVATQVTLKGGKGSKPQSYKTPLAKGMGPNPRWAADNKFTLYDVNATVRTGNSRATRCRCAYAHVLLVCFGLCATLRI